MSRYINLDEAKAMTTQLFHGYEVEQWLDTIPSVDIDRPQGEWKAVPPNAWEFNAIIQWHECSVCKCRSMFISNFCPHCGCRMKGADDE